MTTAAPPTAEVVKLVNVQIPVQFSFPAAAEKPTTTTEPYEYVADGPSKKVPPAYRNRKSSSKPTVTPKAPGLDAYAPVKAKAGSKPYDNPRDLKKLLASDEDTVLAPASAKKKKKPAGAKPAEAA